MHCVSSLDGSTACLVFKIKYALNVLLATALITFIVVSDYRLPLCLKASWLYIGAVVFLETVCRMVISRGRPSGAGFDIPKSKHKGKLGSKIGELIHSGVLSLGSLALCHIITVLLGAPITQGVEETATLAGVISALALVRPVITKGPNQALQLIDTWTWGGEAESRGFFVVFGAWLGALPIPLDWDRPWQAWPLTCVGGALLGELSAHIFLLIQPLPSAKKKSS